MRSPVRALAAALLAAAALAGCSSHMYHAEALVYVDAVHQALIDAGVCESRDACRARQAVFFEAGGFKLGSHRTGGVDLTVYGLASKAVAERVAAACRKVHDRYPGAAVHLTVHSTAHGERQLPSNTVKEMELPAVEGGARHPDSGQ